MSLHMLIGARITDLTAIGLTVRDPYGFAYGGVWTYITPTGVVLTTDLDGVILSADAPTDNDDETSARAARREADLYAAGN